MIDLLHIDDGALSMKQGSRYLPSSTTSTAFSDALSQSA
jgi:hypothetical protein